MRPFGEFASVKDVAAKIADNAARLAANLHVFQFGAIGKINAETMLQATDIALYHLTEARRIYGMVGSTDPDTVNAERLLAYWESEGFESIGKSRIMQYGPLRCKAEFDPTLAILRDHGIARIVKSGGKGQKLEVNPAYIESCINE